MTRARRTIAAAGAAALALALTGATACAQPDAQQGPVAALRAGRYEEAIPALQRLADAVGATAAARRAYVLALLELSRVADAEAAARRYVGAGGPAANALLGALGEAL